MSKKIGVQLTSELELSIIPVRDSSGVIQSGITVGNTLYQNQYMILMAQKSEFKENPTIGVGINDMANDDDLNEWKKSIREELAKDGMKVNTLTITASGMEVKADY